jgi:hypothetical protein
LLLGAATFFFLSLQTRRLFRLSPSFLSRATLFFSLGHAARMFGGEAMRLLFCATLRLCFCLPASFIFSAAALGCLRPKLRFDLCAQAGFLFGATPGLLFSFASGLFFGTTTFSFFSQTLGFLHGPHASLFPGLHALDLFFDGAESCFRSAAQFFFLRAFAGFGFEIVTLLFGSPA